MKTEEWIAKLSETANANIYRFERIRECIPLGESLGEVITAHREERPERYHYVCVSGKEKTDFIRRLCLTLSCLYDNGEAVFLILSPFNDYAGFLQLKNADFTIPYMRTEDDFLIAMNEVDELMKMRSFNKKYPKLFLVVDGLEEIRGLKGKDPSELYMRCVNSVAAGGAEVITGFQIANSVYAGYPGAFIGIGNALVSVKERGKADITYVNTDSSLTAPKEISYPEGDFMSSIDYLNGIV